MGLKTAMAKDFSNCLYNLHFFIDILCSMLCLLRKHFIIIHRVIGVIFVAVDTYFFVNTAVFVLILFIMATFLLLRS